MNNTNHQDLFSLNTRIRHRAVGEDGVLVHLDSGRVIVVNEVGLHIVNLLASPISRQALVDSITRHFNVDADQAATDLELYFAQLEEEQSLARQDQDVPD